MPLTRFFIVCMVLMAVCGLWLYFVASTGEIRIGAVAIAACGLTGAVAGIVSRVKK
ncbi:hypothetical protein [Arthrobacter sp. H14]|uniref:hypothetical protein n=1 Tax=Arthrobacter sp. H14 TaxID=1312959 RepID=UPI0004BC30F3|nr:hypothetical protein [Arthrobacter sp. H14]